MANLTITVPDDILRLARVRAAEGGTSVNAVLREELERYVGTSPDRAVADILERSRSVVLEGEPYVWNRDEIHEERMDKASPPR